MSRLGKNIDEYRTQLGWSLEEFSDKTGIPKSTLSDIMSRSEIKYSQLKIIAKAMNKTIEELDDEKYVQINNCDENKQIIQVNININVNASNKEEAIELVESIIPKIK